LVAAEPLLSATPVSFTVIPGLALILATAASMTAAPSVEMLVDPAANEYTFNGLRTLWSREVCDPVQADAYRIVAGGERVSVSNFVHPAFFNPWAPGPYDRLGVLTEPFSIARGARSAYADVMAVR